MNHKSGDKLWHLATLYQTEQSVDKISILFYTCTSKLDGSHVLICLGLQLYGICIDLL